MSIVIFTDEPAKKGGWHGMQLAQAFAIRGVEITFVSLQDCAIDCSNHSPNIKIPNVKKLPIAVFVRGIAGGTLEQITARLNILHMLKMQGVLVYNDGKAIERTVDKAMTSFVLQHAGIHIPKTWVCESRHIAHAIIKQQLIDSEDENETYILVIKPLFGSQGQGVRLIKHTLPLPGDQFVDGVFYLQQFIAAKHDYRVFIVNNQVISAMRRTGEGWLHNVAQGAQCDWIEDEDVCNIALQAALVLDIAYCGVDIIRDVNGQLLVLEVNSIPAWRGLQSVTVVNIAQALVDDVLVKIG